MALVIDLPIPPRTVSPNARPHWAAVAKAKAKMRADGKLAAKSAIREQRPSGLPWKSATVKPLFFFRVNRKRDRDNFGAMLKAYYDSLQDAGVIVNDCGLIPHPPVMCVDKDDPRVELIVAESVEEER